MGSTNSPLTSVRPQPAPWPTSSGAPPLYATPRNPNAWTDGPQVGAIAKALGTPLLPWQQYVADVANERRPDGSYEYQIVVVSVPRQTGKTTLVRAQGVHTCVVCGRDVFYTAQTGKDARARWMDLVKVLRVNSAFKDRIKVGLRGGAEQIGFGSTAFHCFAPTPESLHGYTPPKVFLDEAFALSESEGELLMGAISPAQLQIVDKQIWIVSTAGTAESTFLHDWIDRGIEGAPRVAVFLWGASDEQDPYDLDDIAAFHPGVGFEFAVGDSRKVLTAADVLAEVERNTRAEYERAFANRRTPTGSNLIPAATWRALGPEDGDDPPAPPSDLSAATLAYDVSVDRRAGAIVAAWPTATGVAVKIVQSAAGTEWMPEAIAALAAAWRVTPRAVGNGPVLPVTRKVRDLGVDVDELNERDYATATGAMLSAIADGSIEHDGHEDLERSVTGLVTRSAGADGVAFSRRHSVGNSAPAVAAGVAHWVATHADAGAPLVAFG